MRSKLYYDGGTSPLVNTRGGKRELGSKVPKGHGLRKHACKRRGEILEKQGNDVTFWARAVGRRLGSVWGRLKSGQSSYVPDNGF